MIYSCLLLIAVGQTGMSLLLPALPEMHQDLGISSADDTMAGVGLSAWFWPVSTVLARYLIFTAAVRCCYRSDGGGIWHSAVSVCPSTAHRW